MQSKSAEIYFWDCSIITVWTTWCLIQFENNRNEIDKHSAVIFCYSYLLLWFFLIYSKTRFRWIQESNSQKNVPPFGLDGVYFSEPCPSYCSGHGDCISGVCFCDLGYTGKTKLFPYSGDFLVFNASLIRQWSASRSFIVQVLVSFCFYYFLLFTVSPF